MFREVYEEIKYGIESWYLEYRYQWKRKTAIGKLSSFILWITGVLFALFFAILVFAIFVSNFFVGLGFIFFLAFLWAVAYWINYG